MIVVAGEALIDLVIGVDDALDAALGGAPYNTARAASRLGAPTSFVGSLSVDRFGTRLVDRLAADGVTTDLSRRTDRPTTLAAAELDERGAASYRFYFAQTAAPLLDDATLRMAVESLGADRFSIFFTGGLGLVLPPMADAIADATERLDDRTTCIVDINCRPAVIDDRDLYLARLDRVIRRADIVKVSDDDLAYLAPDESVTDAAGHLLDRGASAVIVTAGSSHTTIVHASGALDVAVAPLPGRVVDTIGAGDTFGAGLLAWWHGRHLGRGDIDLDPLADAVSAGHAAAAIVVTRRGADPPWRSELPADWSG